MEFATGGLSLLYKVALVSSAALLIVSLYGLYLFDVSLGVFH